MARRTSAKVSLKVGNSLGYQATFRTWQGRPSRRWYAKSVTRVYRPKSAGVVRRVARSDHWRLVSTPRWARASWKVTSTCQRGTNHSTICCAYRAGSVLSRAWVSNVP